MCADELLAWKDVSCLACFDGVSLIQDHDLGRQCKQLVLQLGHKIVAGDQELEALTLQLAVLALGYHVHAVISNAKPLVQRISPLLCTSNSN